jgi:hypothetical protein
MTLTPGANVIKLYAGNYTSNFNPAFYNVKKLQ